MSEINFLNMILSGYYKNPDLLKLYLIRKHKEAEKNHNYSITEFYDNCNIVLENLKQKILNLYHNRKNELYLILSDYKTKDKDTSEIQIQINALKPNDFSIPLFPITNQQFTGHLKYSDIEFIENTIKLIFVSIDENKDYSAQCDEGNFFYSGYENELYTGRQYFEKIYLTKGKLKFPINFPDLIPKYYDLALAEYLEKEKNKAESFFSKELVTLEFIGSELEKTKALQKGIEDFLNKNKHHNFRHHKEQLKYCKRYLAYLSEKFKELDKKEFEKPQQFKTKKTEVSKKLNNFIQNIIDKESFKTELKNLFPTEKGKPIKAIIKILEKNEILLIPDRQFKEFYNCLKIEFKRDIGTYTSINDVKHFHKDYLPPIEKKLNKLIIKHKTR